MYKVLLSYIIGSFPTGYLLTKLFSNTDIRNVGSGSTGTTNVLRSGNKLLAAITLLTDVGKGSLVAYYFGDSFLSLIFCLFGHVFPVWLKFHGGKGVATFAGIIVMLTPKLAIIPIVLWIAVLLVEKISSLASLSLVTSYLILVIATNNSNFYFAIFSFFFICFTHRENIMRLLKKSELKIKKNDKN